MTVNQRDEDRNARLPEHVLREAHEILNAEGQTDYEVLRSALNRAARIYHEEKQDRDGDISPSEIRRQRQKLLRAISVLDEVVDQTDAAVLKFVGQGFDHVIFDQDYERLSTARFAAFVHELRAFRAHLEDHADQSPVSKGPSARRELDTLIEALLDLWGKWLEAPSTHSASKDSIYEGTPQSVAGRYVTTLVKAIDPDIPETRISRALSTALRRARDEDEAMIHAIKRNRLGS